jgi:antirestriction protein ArdC
MRDTQRRDLHADITNTIIAAIEANPGEPQMPWYRPTAPFVLPVNALTRNPYNGINVISLWATSDACSYQIPLWSSYRQWAQLGAQVRKGEKASLVVFYKLCGRPHNL